MKYVVRILLLLAGFIVYATTTLIIYHVTHIHSYFSLECLVLSGLIGIPVASLCVLVFITAWLAVCDLTDCILGIEDEDDSGGITKETP